MAPLGGRCALPFLIAERLLMNEDAMRKALFAVPLVLAACGGTPPQGAGFAPLGAGSPTYDRSLPSIAQQAPREAVRNSGAVPVSLPTRAVTMRSNRMSDMAERAIRQGGSTPDTSVPVTIAGENLSLSIVRVNDVNFAVAKEPSGFFSGSFRTNGKRRAFLDQIPSLTGCQADGGLYTYGPNPTVATGMAAPLVCG